MNALKDNEQYRRVSHEKDHILRQLRRSGFRVTKQRELILDIIFEHECASCKEIYYQAIQKDPKIGMATVYRMVNTLMDIGVLKSASLKPHTLEKGPGSGCEVTLKHQGVITFDQSEWMHLLRTGLQRKGCQTDEILEVRILQ